MYEIVTFCKMDDKKKRSTNFTSTELTLLMKCIFSEIKVIENKHTDGATIKDKSLAWQRIHKNFSSENKEAYRDLNSLKMKYENLKRTLRKKVADHKCNLMKTGGGPPVDLKFTWYEEELYSLLKLGIEGLRSTGDSDITVNVDIAGPSTTQNSIEVDHMYTLNFHSNTPNDDFIGENVYEENLINENFIEEEVLYLATPDKPQLSGVETVPCNENIPLQQETLRTPMTSNRWNLNKRKRKSVTTEDKIHSMESFQKVTESKLDLLQLQQECYKVELTSKGEDVKEKQKELHIKRQILDLELQIKQEQYQQLVEEGKRKTNLYLLQEEEQKLKIDILKCELNAKLRQNLGSSYQ